MEGRKGTAKVKRSCWKQKNGGRYGERTNELKIGRGKEGAEEKGKGRRMGEKQEECKGDWRRKGGRKIKTDMKKKRK